MAFDQTDSDGKELGTNASGNGQAQEAEEKILVSMSCVVLVVTLIHRRR